MDVLASSVGARLREKRAILVCAESCTGGGISHVLTSIPGSSAWFERGFVTYSDASKQELLGISAETLARHGAVSEETAREMALGALARSRGSVSLAVTGIAGPGGGSESKPVGMVCFAWAGPGGAVRSETCYFAGDRESVRDQSISHALRGLLRQLGGA